MTASTSRVRPSPGMEAAPPVTPNLVRPDEIPGARKVGQNTLETLFFRGITTAMCFALNPTYGASGAAVASSIGYAAGALAAWLIFERLARAEPKTR